MYIQNIKLRFIEDFLRLQNEQVILNLINILNSEKKKLYESSLKPMTISEFHKRINQAEKDIIDGNVYSQDQVEVVFKKKYNS